jgi:hypothetical protein
MHFDVILRARGTAYGGHRLFDLISNYTGQVRCRRASDRRTVCVGKFRAFRVNAELAAQLQGNLTDACELHSERLYRLYARLYGPKSYAFRPLVTQQFMTLSSDLLVLDTIVLDPRWRGVRLGLLVARRLVSLLGSGCGLVVGNITPYKGGLRVPAAWVPRYASDRERRDARERLRDYFAAVGFKRVGRSAIYAMSIAEPVPLDAALLGPTNPSKADQVSWR